MGKHSIPLLAALALSAGGCAIDTPRSVAATEVALHEPLPGLYTAGQPAPGDWAPIRARGIHTVINLRVPGELQGRDEPSEVRAAGLGYLEIPVGADGLTAANAQALHAALGTRHGGGVLVHCASSNRAGALLALEQKEFHRLTDDEALEVGRKAGVTGIEPRLRQALGMDD